MLTALPSLPVWPEHPLMTYHALILRNPARAEATVQEFEQLGITSWCAQLIDTIWPTDRTELVRMSEQLLAGKYQWLVVTSVNTVRVVDQLIGEQRLPASLRIASVGEKTSLAISELWGREVDFQPTLQSAAGMRDEWQPETDAHLCYPHGDLASSTLADALALLPVSVDEFEAYRNVAAGSGGVPVDSSVPTQGLNILQAEAISEKLELMDLVVFSAPSVAKCFAELVAGPLPQRMRTIAIGQPTAKAMARASIPVHAIATQPTPRGLADAAKDLLLLNGTTEAADSK